MTPDFSIIDLLLAFTQFVSLIGLVIAWRKLHPEIRKIDAETTKDMADAGNTWLDAYNKVYSLLIQRDVELLDLKRQQGEFALQRDLDRQQLEQVTQERDRYKQALDDFRKEVEEERREYRREIDSLRTQVNQMLESRKS